MASGTPPRIDRRTFLRIAGLGAAGVASASLLAACAQGRSATAGGTARTPAGLRTPITLPISSDNPAIASDLAPETNATFRIAEWRQYLSRSVVDDFARAHDVHVQITSFDDRDKGAALIEDGGAFDVFFPTIDQLGPLVRQQLLQPLNHDYVANLARLWPQFAPPDGAFYDKGLRYSVPYTVFSTGIGWRSDLIAARDAPPGLDDPYSAYWNPRYRGLVGLYDDYREAIATALLKNGNTDVNTTSAPALAAASEALGLLVDDVGAVFDYDGAYEGLPKGEFAIHQAWSGDILSAGRFGGAYKLGTTGDLRFFWPDDGRGIVGADLMAIPAHATNPVLAHLFLNHMLAPENALRNFAWNGYQPPVDGATREDLASRSPATTLAPTAIGSRKPIVPRNLVSALLSPADVERSLQLRPLAPSAQSAWLNVWTAIDRNSAET